MKVEHINPFLEATLKLFKTMFRMTPEVGTPYAVDDFYRHRWEISGVMVLYGSVVGVVAIRLTHYLTRKLLEKSGVEYSNDSEIDELIYGLISELVNIIASSAATSLEEHNISVSVPFVVQGENHSISWPHKKPVIGIPFTSRSGPFAVYVSMA